MRIVYAGKDFPHKNGEFCQRIMPDLYGLFYFHTPFLYEKDGEMLCGNAGELLLTKPGQVVYHGPIDSDHSFVNDWMYVTKDLAPLLEKYPIPCGAGVKISRQMILHRAIVKATEEITRKETGYEEKINCILIEMVIDLHRAWLNHGSESSAMRIATIHDQVMQSPEQDWTLEKMASLCGCSVSHFSWVWSKRYGCSPKAELLQKRLDLAEQMLVCSQLSIGEISERCGFQSIYYFSKCFKKNRGLSPRQFAQMQKKWEALHKINPFDKL